MFTKLKTIKKFNNEIITIQELVSIVKNNNQEELINNIREVEYKSNVYNNLKLKVNAITPHGIFSSLKNSDLISLSGYLYYDIDGFNTEIELNDTINKLMNEGFISFICKSVGGKGISFLIKISDTNFTLNDTNFEKVYSYVRDILIKKGYNIDVAAGGLVRKLFISSDIDVYFNNEVSLSIDKVSFNKFSSLVQSSTFKTRSEKNEYILLANDTFNEIISIDILLKEINIEKKYDKSIDGKFIVEDMDYYKVFIPKIINDGTKHKLYIRIINALYYMNENITKQQVYSYLHYINKNAKPPMNEYKLKELVNYICNNIEKTGEVRIKTRVKRLHFNKESELTKKQKQNMGGQLGPKIRNNKTLLLIEEARMKCVSMNIIPTQKKIQEITGLGIATIKRNWNKEINDLSDLVLKEDNEVNKEKEIIRDSKLEYLFRSDLNEEIFFNDVELKKEK